jgi:hypothetical protein
MSEPENFLQRWSKRKLAQAEPEAPPHGEDSSRLEKEAGEPAPVAAAEGATGVREDQPVELASLPPIEAIGADTDITAFLRPGVPPELTRAALRRAWSTDPAIRDFVGLVENGWDFNDPNAMSGFGPIAPADVARLLGQVIGGFPTADADAQKAPGGSESRDCPPQIGERPEGHATEENREPDRRPDAQDDNAENDATHKSPRG